MGDTALERSRLPDIEKPLADASHRREHHKPVAGFCMRHSDNDVRSPQRSPCSAFRALATLLRTMEEEGNELAHDQNDILDGEL